MADEKKPDYSQFDPKAYYDTYYTSVSGVKGHGNMRLFILDSLADIFMTGKINGDTLLDFGTGPVVYNVISASTHFSNIYLSDFCEANRNALWGWLSNESGGLDHSHFFKYFYERRSTSHSWSIMEESMRQRVKGILHCDMTQSQPLYPSVFPQFDCITSGLCLDVAPGLTTSAYKSAAKNLMTLLKPGGWMVINGPVDGTCYTFGGKTYPVVNQSPDEIRKTWSELGFTIDVWKQYDMTSMEVAASKNSNAKGMFCMSAQKTSSQRSST